MSSIQIDFDSKRNLYFYKWEVLILITRQPPSYEPGFVIFIINVNYYGQELYVEE